MEPGRAVKGSGIAAVSYGDTKSQVFWVGEDRHVKSVKFIPGHNSRWQEDPVPTPDGADRADRGVTALSRRPGLVEVWWKLETRGVVAAFRQDSDQADGQWCAYWADKEEVSKNENIAALSREPEHQEIWWGDGDRKIRNRYFEGDWTTLEIPPEPFKYENSIADDSRLTGACRDKDHMALFYITPSGKIRGAFWSSTSHPKWTEDVIVWKDGPKTDDEEKGEDDIPIARADSDVKVISFDAGQYDLVWVGPDCSLRGATIYPETRDTNGKRHMRTYRISGSGTVSAGSPLGIFKFEGQRSFGVLFVDRDETLTAGYCTNPV